MQKLQEKIIEFGSYLNNVTNLGLSENQRDLYYILDKLVDEVRDSYPQVPCKDKCSACCIHSGLPRVTAIEWQAIHKYLLKSVSEENKKQIINQLIDMHSDQVDELLKEQERIKYSHTKINENTTMTRPNFKCSQCPFLINNSCTIYPVRPAICRAYGFFSIRVAGKSQIFTCQMAAEQIIGLLKEKGIAHWALPVWDKFSDKIYQLNDDKPVATLPLWLMAHIDKNGNINLELNKNPDFEKLIEIYQNTKS